MKKAGTGLLIFALFIAALNLRPAINSIAPIIETIRESLGMSASVASLLTAIPVLCMGIFSPLAAKLGGRWGIERVICWSLALIGIGTALRLFANTTWLLLVTSFLAGLGIAAMGPLLAGFIKGHFSSQVPTMISIQMVALTIGVSAASGLTVPLQDGLHSWQASLAVWAVLAIMAVPVWLFVLRRIEATAPPASLKPPANLPWRNKEAWLLTLSFGVVGMIFYTITAWLPPIIQDMGYGKVYAGNVLTIFAAIQIPVSLLVPKLLKWSPSRLMWLLIAGGLELFGLILLLLSAPPWIAAIIIGTGAGILFPINLMLPIDRAASAQDAANWSAMVQSIGFAISALGPMIPGWIYDITGKFSYAVFGLIVMVLSIMVITVIAVPRQSKQQILTKA